MKQPPILLTGAARSGTSMTAGILYLCGAFGGAMSGPTQYNKRGMFENANIRNKIVKPYLRRLGVDPLGQRPLPDVSSLTPYRSLRSSVCAIMQKEGYKKGPWFYKGAKLCLIWPIWHKAFPKAKWIIVRRSDEDIINSCLHTGFMRGYSTSEGWQYWVDEHKKRISEMKHSGMDVCEVWPSKFVAGDTSEIRGIVEDCGLLWNEDAVTDFITPALWSQRRKDNGSTSNAG